MTFDANMLRSVIEEVMKEMNLDEAVAAPRPLPLPLLLPFLRPAS